MAEITFKGNTVKTSGSLPAVGSNAPAFELTKVDLSTVTNEDLKGKKAVLNIFPSIDTGVCAASARKFNELASKMDNTIVLNISKDLPFAHNRFCAAEGLQNVHGASQFKNDSFTKNYGVEMVDGPLAGLMSRAVVVLDENGVVKYTEQVPEIAQEPNYEEALKAL
ncbi:MAG: thiol peroxidase [Flavobacteriales bacterium]